MRDSERRFRELADTAPALMWMTRPGRPRHLRERGLAALHRPLARGRARRQLRLDAPIPTTASGSWRPGARRWRVAPSSARSSACAATTASTAGCSRSATPRLRRRRVRGLRGHGHRHPRAPDDGGGAARQRAHLPPGCRQRAGDDLDHRHERRHHVRERGLDRLHRAVRWRRSSERPGRSACTPTTPRASSRAGRRRSRAAGAGSASTGCAATTGVPLDRGARGAALRGRGLRGLCGQRHRHPRAPHDGGAPARGLRARAPHRGDAPAQPAAGAAAAHRGAGDRSPLPARR